MKRILQSMALFLIASGILVPVHAGSAGIRPARTVAPMAKQRQQVRQLADTLHARPTLAGVAIPIPTLSTPLDKPDLCVEDLWLGAGPNYPTYMTRVKRNIAPGDTICLVCDYSDQGKAIVQQWWKIGFYVDGILVSTTDNRDINSGGHSYGVAKVAAPQTQGVHYYECRLDCDSSIPESDERNNRKEIPFRVGPSPTISGDVPDLIVSDIRLDGTNIEIWIQNIGGGVVKTLSLQAYMDGNSMGPEIVIDDPHLYLGPGDSAHFTQFYWTLGVSTNHVIRAVVDASNRLHESNEGNNEMTVRITRR